MRFGIGRSDLRKLDDIADELNVSGEREYANLNPWVP